ncbi:hypothetical protein [Hafnia sp. HMSC23F03]|nr:hypothetical protein [Hafnia sp. HMSC23F03]
MDAYAFFAKKYAKCMKINPSTPMTRAFFARLNKKGQPVAALVA